MLYKGTLGAAATAVLAVPVVLEKMEAQIQQ